MTQMLWFFFGFGVDVGFPIPSVAL